MSTYTYFYPSDEKISELREEVERSKRWKPMGCSISPKDELMLATLRQQKKDYENPNFSNAYFSTKIQLKAMAEKVKMEMKESMLKDLDECKEGEPKSFYFCGRYDFVTPVDELIENTTIRLVILRLIVEHPDYFKENENFYTLQNDINEEIAGFEECIVDSVISELMEEYDDFRKTEHEDYLLRKELGLLKDDDYYESENDVTDSDENGENAEE